MKTQCPKCGTIFSDHEYRSIAGRWIEKNGRKSLFVVSCPKCLEESYTYNEAGNTDKGSWVELKESGEKYNPETDYVSEFRAHSFRPMNLAECNNTCCLECVFSKNVDVTHDETCNHRMKLSREIYQADLFSYGMKYV